MEIVNREEPPLEWKLAQPIVWATLNCGVRVQELLPDKYEAVAELIRAKSSTDRKQSRLYFVLFFLASLFPSTFPQNLATLVLFQTQLIPRETMCKALNMHDVDPDSCETFVQESICCMRDGFSIVGIVEEEVTETGEAKKVGKNGDNEIEREIMEEKEDNKGGEQNDRNTNTVERGSKDTGAVEEDKSEEGAVRTKERVVAAMIARVVQKREAMETFSRVKIYKGETYKKYAKLNNHMMSKADLYTAYNTDSYFRIYHIVVHEDFKNRGISLFMGKLATLRLTALFKQTICIKLCPDRPTQHLMRRLSFSDYLRLGYEEWLERGNQIFFNTGVGNYSIVLMVYQAVELRDVNEPLEEVEIEYEPGRYSVFPGRAKTGEPSVGNRGHLLKPTPPIVTGRLADYRYLFHKGFDDVLSSKRN